MGGAPERNPHAPVRTDRSRRHERSRAAPRCPRRPRSEKANPILNRRNRFEPLPAGLRARVAARALGRVHYRAWGVGIRVGVVIEEDARIRESSLLVIGETFYTLPYSLHFTKCARLVGGGSPLSPGKRCGVTAQSAL